MNIRINRFHYITQDNIPGRDHEWLASTACNAGVRWVQFRSKFLPYSDWLNTTIKMKKITDSFGAILIINDHVAIAKEINANGVHLGKEDMKPDKARKILGDERIIGLTINSDKKAIKYKNAPVNYFGVGPYHFTHTKKNLSPVLGLKGILKIAEILAPKPVIAIGGIQLEDVKQILDSGIYGFAVSSGINCAQDVNYTVENFLNEIRNWKS